MSNTLTGHVVLEVDGDQQPIGAQSFVEEEDGLWKYYGEGFTLLVTVVLGAAVDDQGNYPILFEDPDIEGALSVKLLEFSLAAPRAPIFDQYEDSEDDEIDEADEEPEER